MYCKHCGKELVEGKTVCSGCGKDNAEKKDGIVITPGKLALSIGVVVVLIAVLAALIVGGMASTGSNAPATDPTETTAAQDSTDATGETTAATVPADTGLNDVTCKGTYTVSDEEAIAAMNNVVATLGDDQLTSAQLQVCYWLQVNNFLSSEDCYYLYYYYGLFDYAQPLDTQMCYYDSTLTWQQYFLKGAFEAWQSYRIMANEAEANGFQLPAEFRDDLDAMPQQMEQSAQENGFESVEEMLVYNLGPGTTMEDYMAFWEMYYLGYTYYAHLAEQMMPTDEEAEAFFDENADIYSESGITKDTTTVDVRHVLILPEGATIDTIYSETFSDEAWEAARVQAQGLLDAWSAQDGTEDGFAAMANENSVDPGSNTNGGLYTDVAQGDMVEAFDAWCFDAARQPGDSGLVKTELGYHIMYFSGSSPLWLEYAKEDLLAERSNTMLEEASAKYPMEVDYSAVVLGFVDLAG